MSPDLLPSLLPVPPGGPQPTGADKSLTAPPILQPDVSGCIQLPQALTLEAQEKARGWDLKCVPEELRLSRWGTCRGPQSCVDSGRGGAATTYPSVGSRHVSLAAGKAGFSPSCLLFLLLPSQFPSGTVIYSSLTPQMGHRPQHKWSCVLGSQSGFLSTYGQGSTWGSVSRR